MEHPPAQFFQRLSALFLDVILQFIVAYLILPVILSQLLQDPDLRGPLVGVGLVVTIFFYEPLLVSIRGKTIGHQIFGVRVQNSFGEKINFIQAIIRFWAKWFLGLFSFFSMLGEKRQAIHDHLTGSVVVSVR